MGLPPLVVDGVARHNAATPATLASPMSHIDIRHAHALTKPKARKVVEEVANKLAERFQMQCDWAGDVLNFSRAGVDGHIALGPKDVHVNAKLGFLAGMFRDSIESEIRRVLDENFTA